MSEVETLSDIQYDQDGTSRAEAALAAFRVLEERLQAHEKGSRRLLGRVAASSSRAATSAAFPESEDEIAETAVKRISTGFGIDRGKPESEDEIVETSAKPHRQPVSAPGYWLISLCGNDTNRRYNTLCHVEKTLPPDSDYGFLVLPACQILESELGTVLVQPAWQIAHELIAALRDTTQYVKQADILQEWASKRVPTTIGIVSLLMLAIRKGHEQGRLNVRCFLSSKLRQPLASALITKQLGIKLDAIRSQFRNPACHGAATFDANGYESFIRLLLCHKSINNWNREGEQGRDLTGCNPHGLSWSSIKDLPAELRDCAAIPWRHEWDGGVLSVHLSSRFAPGSLPPNEAKEPKVGTTEERAGAPPIRLLSWLAAELSPHRVAILHNLDDDEPRLKLADWLESHGKTGWARFIRAQIASQGLADTEKPSSLGEEVASCYSWLCEWIGERADALDGGAPGSAELSHALAQLYAELSSRFSSSPDRTSMCLSDWKHVAESLWTVMLPPLSGIRWSKVSRGTVSEIVSVDENALYDNPGILDTAPVRNIRLTAVKDARRLAKLEVLSRVTALNLESCQITDLGVEVLAESPVLQNLKTLSLQGNRITDRGARAIAVSSYLLHLACLRVENNEISARGVNELRTSPKLSSLITVVADKGTGPGLSVGMTGAYLGDWGCARLAETAALAAGGRLRLHRQKIGDAGVAALAASVNAAALTWLDLDENHIGLASARAIAASTQFACLRVLNLNENAIGDEGALALAESPLFKQLQTLAVRKNGISTRVAGELKKAAKLSGLQRLVLDDTPTTYSIITAPKGGVRPVDCDDKCRRWWYRWRKRLALLIRGKRFS